MSTSKLRGQASLPALALTIAGTAGGVTTPYNSPTGWE
jgi:hypothetical protein